MDKSNFLIDGKWKCNSCGACCKSVYALVQKGIFPIQWMNKKGGCINQLKNGKCKIYETRPPYCRIDHTLRPTFSDNQIAEFCQTMSDHQESA